MDQVVLAFGMVLSAYQPLLSTGLGAGMGCESLVGLRNTSQLHADITAMLLSAECEVLLPISASMA